MRTVTVYSRKLLFTRGTESLNTKLLDSVSRLFALNLSG